MEVILLYVTSSGIYKMEVKYSITLKTLCKEKKKKNSFSFYIDNILIQTSSS